MQKNSRPSSRKLPGKAIGSYVQRIRETAKVYKDQKGESLKENALSTILNESCDTVGLLRECREECLQLKRQRESDRQEYARLLEAAAEEIKVLQGRVAQRDKACSKDRHQHYDLQRQKNQLSKEAQALERKAAEEARQTSLRREELARKYECQLQ
jgi:hypothetical protein